MFERGERWVWGLELLEQVGHRQRHGAVQRTTEWSQPADTANVEILRAPEAHSVFARLPDYATGPLQDWSFFWTWGTSKPWSVG